MKIKEIEKQYNATILINSEEIIICVPCIEKFKLVTADIDSLISTTPSETKTIQLSKLSSLKVNISIYIK